MRHILSGARLAQNKFARLVRGYYFDAALKSESAEQAALFFELVVIYGGAVILSMAGVAVTQPNGAISAARIVGEIGLLVIVVLELGRHGKVTAASWLLILASIAVITRNSLHAGGIRSPGVTLFYVFPLIGALLLGERAGIAIALLCAMIGLGLVEAERAGLLPAQSIYYAPLAYWWLNCFYIILVFAVLHTAVKKINRAYRQARATLQERRQAEQRLSLALKAGTIGFWESDRKFETFFPIR